MNWEAIKFIYYSVLIHGDKIEYLGGNKYKLIYFYPTGEKFQEVEYQNGELHGKSVGWHENGNKTWEEEYQDGNQMNWKAIKYIYCRVLVHKDRIEYLGGDKYRLTKYYNEEYGPRKVQYEYKNRLKHGISTYWGTDRQISCKDEWQNGSFIRQIYPRRVRK